MNIIQTNLKSHFSFTNIGKITFLLVILFFLFSSQVIKSQIQNYPGERMLPHYKERYISRDSLLINQNMTEDNESIDPDEYIVGPGDKIFISINGLEEIPLTVRINHDGILYIPKVGGIDLKNTTLTGAKTKILNAINKYYKNVDVFISLINIRKIKGVPAWRCS